MEDKKVRWGYAKNKNISELGFKELLYYYNWYKKAVDTPDQRQAQYAEDNKQFLVSLIEVFEPVLQEKLVTQGEEFLKVCNKDITDFKAIDLLFLSKTPEKNLLTNIIAEGSADDMLRAYIYLDSLINKLQLKKAS